MNERYGDNTYQCKDNKTYKFAFIHNISILISYICLTKLPLYFIINKKYRQVQQTRNDVNGQFNGANDTITALIYNIYASSCKIRHDKMLSAADVYKIRFGHPSKTEGI